MTHLVDDVKKLVSRHTEKVYKGTGNNDPRLGEMFFYAKIKSIVDAEYKVHREALVPLVPPTSGDKSVFSRDKCFCAVAQRRNGQMKLNKDKLQEALIAHFMKHQQKTRAQALVMAAMLINECYDSGADSLVITVNEDRT